jgi:hypothetical protein
MMGSGFLPQMAGTQPYLQRLLSIEPGNLLGFWPLNETSGADADNAQGIPARDGAYSAVTLNQSTFLNDDPVGLWDGVNDGVNLYTTSYRDAFNGGELTFSMWLKVADAGVWADGAVRVAVDHLVDGNNYFELYKSSTDNTFVFDYKAGGSLKRRTVTISDAGWNNFVLRVCKAEDLMRFYLNGIPQGADIASLGAWAGTLHSNRAVLGLNAWLGHAFRWSGHIAYVMVWDKALTDEQIGDIYGWAG